jgi:hypothetical protein
MFSDEMSRVSGMPPSRSRRDDNSIDSQTEVELGIFTYKKPIYGNTVDVKKNEEQQVAHNGEKNVDIEDFEDIIEMGSKEFENDSSSQSSSDKKLTSSEPVSSEKEVPPTKRQVTNEDRVVVSTRSAGKSTDRSYRLPADAPEHQESIDRLQSILGGFSATGSIVEKMTAKPKKVRDEATFDRALNKIENGMISIDASNNSAATNETRETKDKVGKKKAAAPKKKSAETNVDLYKNI